MEEKLIHKLAHRFWWSGIDHEDLFQEACTAYIAAEKKYDKERGKLTTLLWKAMENHLHTFIREQVPPVNPCADETALTDHYPNTLERIIFMETMHQLGKNASTIVQFILDNPKPFLKTNSPEAARRELRKQLKRKMQPSQIKRGFTQIKKALAA